MMNSNKIILYICLIVLTVFWMFGNIKKRDKKPPFALMFALLFNLNFFAFLSVEFFEFPEEKSYISEILNIAVIIFCNIITRIFNKKYLDNILTTSMYENIMRGFILFFICFSVYENDTNMAIVKSALLVGTYVSYSVDKPDIKKIMLSTFSEICVAGFIAVLYIVIDNLSVIYKIPGYISILLTIIILCILWYKREKKSLDDIKKAKVNDASEIAQIAFKMSPESDLSKLESYFIEIIKNNDVACFIKYVNKKVVGVALCQLHCDYFEDGQSTIVCCLKTIYVLPEYKNCNYSEQLFRKCERWAKFKGCFEFITECQIDDDTEVLFYTKMGFEETNRVVNFKKNWIDSIIYRIIKIKNTE